MPQQKGKIRPLDAAILLACALCAVLLFHRAREASSFTWDWSNFLGFLVFRNPETGAISPGRLALGLFTTVKLSLWAIILAFILGVFFGLLRAGRDPFGRMVGRLYVACMRNTPILVLVFLFYYFLSSQALPANAVAELARKLPALPLRILSAIAAPPGALAAFLSAVITLAAYEGAYIAEIVRAGIQSIGTGQWEASHALGLSYSQTLRHIIGPQALARIIPPLTGQFISTIKDSSIMSVISIAELTFQGSELTAATHRGPNIAFEVWVTVAALYMILTFTCSLASKKAETFLSHKLPAFKGNG
ncbi:MAG: amino acid ABC transporter permease [Thermodesulfobacteriota bacterium]